MIDVIIIGGGVAGMQSAIGLHDLGYQVLVIEKEKQVGGHVANWHTLFPTTRDADEVIHYYKSEIKKRNIVFYTNTVITSLAKTNKDTIELKSSHGSSFTCRAAIMATGYSLFNPRRKEEYGYGIYPNVLSSAEFESYLSKHEANPESSTLSQCARVAFIHCVGSRDEKSGNNYCSKVCCVTAVKQAIAVKKLSPQSEVFCFYMDLRMYGPGFEEMYREAQETWGVQFIRGRLSEVALLADNRLQLKAEDTLAARPIKLSADMIVLMIGMEPNHRHIQLADELKLEIAQNKFIASKDCHLFPGHTSVKGLFTAGSSTGPLSVYDTLNHSKSTVLEVHNFLLQKTVPV